MQHGFGGDSAPQQSSRDRPTENVSFGAFPIPCCRRRRYISGRKHLLPTEARSVKFPDYLRCPIDGPKGWMRRRRNVARGIQKQLSGEYVGSEAEQPVRRRSQVRDQSACRENEQRGSLTPGIDPEPVRSTKIRK
jgi:hypothetical protein